MQANLFLTDVEGYAVSVSVQEREQEMDDYDINVWPALENRQG